VLRTYQHPGTKSASIDESTMHLYKKQKIKQDKKQYKTFNLNAEDDLK